MIASSEAKVLIEIAQKRIARVQIITQPPPSPTFFPLFSQAHPKITFSLSKRCRFGKRWYR